jgi:hypothetical protein
VRGGGAGDRALGRAADFTALADYDAVRRALVSAGQYTPAGLANWKPASGADAGVTGVEDAVKRGDLMRGVIVADGSRRFGVLLGVRRAFQVHAAVSLEIELVDPVSGSVLTQATLAAGQAFDVRPRSREGGDGFVLRATR